MSTSKSKFADILSAAREDDPPELPQAQAERSVGEQRPARRAATTDARPVRRAAASDVSNIGTRGRPRTGKRSDEGFEQVTAYIRRDTHRKIKIALLETDDGRDFSDLVEDLLTRWLSSQRR
jgi:hypothetical protein